MRSVNLAGALAVFCLVGAVFLATRAAAQLVAPAGQAQSQTLAFHNVTVIDGTSAAAQPGMTVVVTGNRITAVGRDVQVPRQARVIDGTGKFLIPTGKLADLVLLDANPLDQIANTRRINAVVMNGRLIDRKALDELLAHLAAAGTN